MSTNRLFYPAGLDVLGTYYAHVNDQENRQNFDDLTEFASGDPAPSWTGARAYEPQFGVDSLALSSVLGQLTTDAICTSCAAGDVKLYFRQAKDTEIRYGEDESQHTIYTMTNNALAFWDQIRATQDREATIAVEVHGTDNGSNDPLTLTTSQTITTAPVVGNLFTLGPIYIDTTLVSGVQSMTWANNVQLDKVRSNGDTAPSWVGIRQYRPVCTVEALDIQTQAGYAVTGNALSGNGLTVFLRARSRTGINYADDQEQHIKLDATDGAYRVTRTAGEQSTGTVEFSLERPSAGAAVFSVTTGTTITAPS